MDFAERLEAARRGAAVGPVEERAILRLSGADAVSYLHRISTQDVGRLAPGASAYAAFLEVKGHLVSDALLRFREEDVLLVAAAEAGPALGAHLARYRLASRVAVEELSPAWRCLPVLGPEGAARARRDPPGGASVEDPRRGAPAVDLLLPAAEAGRLRAELLAGGAADLTASDLEALRLLAGLPRFGADMDGGRLVVEAGLSGPAVSFEKGCYLGQEVVLRATFRGQVQRGLVQLSLPAGAAAGGKLLAGGAEAGAITSCADTPEGRVGLGYLRRAFWKPGTRLALGGGGEAVVRRPLVEERA
jgi:tRNA-modifying protein YgfZ